MNIRKQVFFVLLTLFAAACSDGGGSGVVGGLPATPTVDMFQALTHEVDFPVSGMRATGTEIAVIFEGTQDPVQVAVPFGIPTWNGTVPLEEGENRFAFVARTAAGAQSLPTETFTVTLDTVAPAAPELSGPAPDCVEGEETTLTGTVEQGARITVNGEVVEGQEGETFEVTVRTRATTTLTARDAAGNDSEALTLSIAQDVPLPTLDPIQSPALEPVQTISGTQDPNFGVAIRFEGEETPLLQIDPGDEVWEFTLDLTAPGVTFYLSGMADSGANGCTESGPHTIVYSDVCSPVINLNALEALTRADTVEVNGERCADVGVWLRRDGQSPEEAVEVVAEGPGGAFAFDLTGLEEGENTFFVFNRDSEGLASAEAGPFVVVRDTEAPEPPRFDPAPPEVTAEPTIPVSGTKEADTTICLRQNLEPVCTEVRSLNPETTFELARVTLSPEDEGFNQICVSSADAAGNLSDETCAEVRFASDGGPQITFIAPNLDAIVDGPFEVVVIVDDPEGVDTVEICLEDDCAEVRAQGSTYERTVDPGAPDNATPLTVRVNARNGLDVPSSAQIDVLFQNEGVIVSDSVPLAGSAGARLALDGDGLLHAVWYDECAQFEDCGEVGDGNIPPDIFHSTFDGTVWSPIVLVSEAIGDGDSRNPDIATDAEGNVHIVWQDDGDIDGAGFDFDIFHRKLDVENNVWEPIELVTGGSAQDDQRPALATGPDGELMVVWERRTGIDFSNDVDIFLAIEPGDGWGPERLISDAPGNRGSRNPDIATDTLGVVTIVWQDDGDIDGSGTDKDIYLRTLTGETLSDTLLVTDNILGGSALLPRVTTDGGNRAHIVWQDNGDVLGSGDDIDIFYRDHTPEDGLGSIRLASQNDTDSQEVSITADPDTDELYVAWAQCQTPDCFDADIQFARFVGAFLPAETVSDGPRFDELSEFPDVLFDPATGNLHIIWEDDANGFDDRDVFHRGIRMR